MNKIKSLLMAGSVLVAMLASMPANAGLQVDAVYNNSNATASLKANTTTNLAGTVFDLSKTTDATIECSFKCSAASGANYVFTFDAALNGNNSDRWVSNAISINVVGAGTQYAIATSNLISGARWPALRLASIANTNASAPYMTNIMVRVFTKTGL